MYNFDKALLEHYRNNMVFQREHNLLNMVYGHILSINSTFTSASKWFPTQKQASAFKNNLVFLFGLPNMLRQRLYKKQLQFDDIADIKKTLMTGLNQPTPLTFCPENHL